jgi:hypothetical protein
MMETTAGPRRRLHLMTEMVAAAEQAAEMAAVTVVGVVRTTAAAAAMEAGTGMGMGTATTRNLLRYGPFAGPG